MTVTAWMACAAITVLAAAPASAAQVELASRVGLAQFESAAEPAPVFLVRAPVRPDSRRTNAWFASDGDRAVPLVVAIPAEFVGAGISGALIGTGALVAVIIAGGCIDRDCGLMEEGALLVGGSFGAATGAYLVGTWFGDEGSWFGGMVGAAVGSAIALAVESGSDAWIPIAMVTVPLGATAGYRLIGSGLSSELP